MRAIAEKLLSRLCPALALGLCLYSASAFAPAWGAPPDEASVSRALEAEAEAEDTSFRKAMVQVDGASLFPVRGIESFPARKRASDIAGRIVAAAEDPLVSVDSLALRDTGYSTEILIGGKRLMSVFDIDAKLQDVSRAELAHAFQARIRETIERYRRDRRPEEIRKRIFFSAGATATFLALGAFFYWLFRVAGRRAELSYQAKIQSLKVGAFEVVRAERLRAFVRSLLNGFRWLVFFALGYLYLENVLSRFPWTRGVAADMVGLVMDPLRTMWRGIVDYLPKLGFLIVLVLVTVYLLKLVKIFFRRVERGTVRLAGFEPDWAKPTFNLIRISILAFAMVVAYPYIPGSGSEAFKGVTIFLGVIVSLGSTSVVSSIISGYTIIYRRAFKLGDRIQIGEHLGDVVHKTLLATYLRTIKNETVVVPNSLILGSNLVNYSSLAAAEGLILHSSVGIGYETPWRQVEAMLLDAADRTPGLLKSPPPFVLQKSLGDFAVTYEINAYCAEPARMFLIYADLHRNILDVFNEHGVQIMTPAYVADPETAKWVPKERWFAPPAKPPADGK